MAAGACRISIGILFTDHKLPSNPTVLDLSKLKDTQFNVVVIINYYNIQRGIDNIVKKEKRKRW